MAEINNNEILFKYKGAGISCFCQRRVSVQEHPEKKNMSSDIFDHKLTDTDWGRQCETVWSMDACEGYKVIEMFDKVC